MTRPRPFSVFVAAALAGLAVACAWAWPASPSRAQSESGLRNQISGSANRERSLVNDIARLSQLQRRAAHAVAILQARLNAAQSQYDEAQARETRTLNRLNYQRRRAVRLSSRLRQTRARLAIVLRSEYENPPPDLMSVIFNAHGFADLLDTVDSIRRVQRNDQQIVALVRHARRDAGHQRAVLTLLENQQRAAVASLLLRRNALAQIGAGLQARETALAQATAARQAALRATRASRARAEKILAKLISEQERAAVSHIGPGGPWAIPWAVVQCESGGQNLPPNSATASGYYQFIIPTWRRMGGSTPQAYQASKAEQDRLAAKLWDGGRGAGNWDCAYIVGIL
jgi:peptidoglycan hydrolase CwlO-like protein